MAHGCCCAHFSLCQLSPPGGPSLAQLPPVGVCKQPGAVPLSLLSYCTLSASNPPTIQSLIKDLISPEHPLGKGGDVAVSRPWGAGRRCSCWEPWGSPGADRSLVCPKPTCSSIRSVFPLYRWSLLLSLHLFHLPPCLMCREGRGTFSSSVPSGTLSFSQNPLLS